MDSRIRSLLAHATPLVGELPLGSPDCNAATVAAAVLSASGRVYTGVCLHLGCGIGFCAEHAAIAEMVKARETKIDAVVAVSSRGIVAPCGRCRELMVQVDPDNFSATVALPGDRTALLQDLLPHHWSANVP